MPNMEVLVVDDDAAVSRVLQRWLTDRGYLVESARTFDQVRDALASAEFDLVTLDIVMADVNGLAILEWIREHHPDTEVVMATVLSDLDTVLEAVRKGAAGYLVKPFNLDLVAEEISRTMRHRLLVQQNRAYRRELERKVEDQTRALRRAYAQLEKKARELEGRDRLMQLQMSPPEDMDTAYARILEIVAWTTGASRMTLLRPEGREGRLVPCSRWTCGAPDLEPVSRGAETRPETEKDPEDTLAVRVFRRGEASRAADGRIGAPIQYSHQILGVLEAAGIEQKNALDLLTRLARDAALVLHIVEVAIALEQGDGHLDQLLRGHAASDPDPADPHLMSEAGI